MHVWQADGRQRNAAESPITTNDYQQIAETLETGDDDVPFPAAGHLKATFHPRSVAKKASQNIL